MSSDHRLWIIQSEKDKNGEHKGYFCIDHELAQVSEEVLEHKYIQLLQADPVNISGYDAFSPIIRSLVAGQSSVTDAIVIYERLKERINDYDPDTIVICESVDPTFQKVIADCLNTENINHILDAEANSYIRLFSAYLRLVVLLLEHTIYSLFSLGKEDVDIVCILSKYESSEPVVNEIEQKNADVHRLEKNTSGQFKQLRQGQRRRDYCSSMSQFMTLNVLYEELLFYFQFSRHYFSGKLTTKIVQTVENQTNINMPRTVSYILQQSMLNNNIETYTYLFATKSIIKQSNCDKVVIDGMSPSGRAIAQSASKQNVDVFHIPHSIATPYYSTYPKISHFVSGQLDINFLKKFNYQELNSNFLPYGRPYLYDLYTTHNQSESTETESTTEQQHSIMIATQPTIGKFDFIETVLSMIELSNISFEVVIKIHPSESMSEYNKYKNWTNSSIKITDDKLFERLQNADLLLTRNSNVGLEAMMIGTPCATFIPNIPVSRRMPYMFYDEVPVLTDASGLKEFISSIDSDFLYNLKTNQREVTISELQLSESPSELIAEAIVE